MGPQTLTLWALLTLTLIASVLTGAALMARSPHSDPWLRRSFTLLAAFLSLLAASTALAAVELRWGLGTLLRGVQVAAAVGSVAAGSVLIPLAMRVLPLRTTAEVDAANDLLRNEVYGRICAEAAVRASDERLQSLLSDVLDVYDAGIVIIDATGRVAWVNRAIETFFGIRRESLTELSTEAYIDALKPLFIEPSVMTQRLLDSRKTKDGRERAVLRIRRSGVTGERWLEHRSHSISHGFYAGGLVEQFHDITELSRATQTLLQAQKMDAVGRLTGGIAHDFNNLITIVDGNLMLVAEAVEDRKDIQSQLDAARAALSRGASLIQQLMAFSRRQPLQSARIGLGDVVEHTVDLVKRALGETIEIQTRLQPDLWFTQVDPVQLETSLVNLAVNARDAMPNGGQLTIRTRNVRVNADRSRRIGVKAGDYVGTSVTDTGVGMSPEVRKRVFEPFFSTKGNRGTGLGLSMVYGFVRQSGGHIHIISQPGQGTTVEIWLPRSDPPAEPPAAPVQERLDLPRGRGEHILVVEDDDDLRTLAERMLTGLGYRVSSAGDAALAMKKLDESGDIRLLFTDLVLRGPTDGINLAADAQMLHPNLRVLYTSGYAESFAERPEAPWSGKLIRKPYTVAHLATALDQALAKSCPIPLETPD